MKPIFVKELFPYSKEQLKEIFDTSDDSIVILIKKLKEYNVLKQCSKNKKYQDISELAIYDVYDVIEDGDSTCFAFTFVGVLCINGITIMCYPKYISKSNEPIDELKQVIKVIKKYNSKEEIIRMFNGDGESSSFNLLAVMLYLLNDYYDNGLYDNYVQIIEDNGMGEILWNKTINETFAIIQNNKPIYTTLKNGKKISNDYDFFRRLHASVLVNITKNLKDGLLLDLFGYDDECSFLYDECLEDLGDIDYLLYRIEQELSVQFNTHKQIILKTLYAYLSSGKTLEDIDSFSLFGTNSFNLVWEDVCSKILDNKLNTFIKDIGLPIGEVAECYKDSANTELINIIGKPEWFAYIDEKKENISNGLATETLIPDIVTISNSNFIIVDAKYYNIVLNEMGVSHQPALESVTKQYLYQLAYKDFISQHGFEKTSNCFLFPTEEEHIAVNGFVKMQMFESLGLSNIEVRLLPAKDAYDLYLKNEKLPVVELKL